jgi:tetratricopeptide (TPR) repeat protein
MDSRIAWSAALAVAAAGLALPVRAAFEKVEPCRDAVEVTLREAGFRDLSWTVCGDGGDIGMVSAAWDTSVEPYSEELHAAVQAEEGRASAVRSTRRDALVDVSLELDSRGTRRRVDAQALAVGAPPRTVAGAVTLQAEAHPGRLVAVTIVGETARAIARRLAEATALRIDGIDRVAETPMTLNFQLIPVRTVLQLVAEEGGVLLLQAHPDRFAFSTATEAKAFNDARADVERLRAGEDEPALEKALARLVAAAPAPRDGLTVYIGEELDELARLAGARKDYAAAEKHQRRRLALIERLDGTRDTAEAIETLDQLATLRALQDDAAGSNALYREAVERADRVPDVDAEVVGHAWSGLAAHALLAGDQARSDELFAKAAQATAKLPPDSLGALRSSMAVFSYAATLESAGRFDEARAQLERHLAIMRAHYGDDDPITGTTIEALGRIAFEQDDMERARTLFDRALALRRADGATGAGRAAWVTEKLAVIDALGPYAQRDVGAKAAEQLRRQLAKEPPSAEVLSSVEYVLDRRAERQRAARLPQLASTCDGYAEVMAAGVRIRSQASDETAARIADLSRRNCLAGDR